MTRKAENVFISGVHKYLPSELALHREKMNNPYRGGTADWWYSAVLDLWVEYKYMLRLPKRDSTVVVPALSGLQLDWCTRRFNEGRYVRVILGCRDGAVVFRSPSEWAEGLLAAECRKRLLARKDLAQRIADHCISGAFLC